MPEKDPLRIKVISMGAAECGKVRLSAKICVYGKLLAT